MQTLRIETGHPATRDAQPVAGNAVRFVTDDDRTMFEVRIGDDGRSLEVRAVDTCRHDGKLYDTRLEIAPVVSNAIEVRTALYRGA